MKSICIVSMMISTFACFSSPKYVCSAQYGIYNFEQDVELKEDYFDIYKLGAIKEIAPNIHFIFSLRNSNKLADPRGEDKINTLSYVIIDSNGNSDVELSRGSTIYFGQPPIISYKNENSDPKEQVSITCYKKTID